MRKRLLAAFILLAAAPAGFAQTKTQVIAHRGGARESTENTIEAFQRAVRIGAAGIETDIRLTKDGEVVIYHDDTVGRVENGFSSQKGPLVSDLTYAELISKTFKPVGDDSGGRHAPKFKDLLDRVPTVMLNVEMKRCERFDELVEKTIAILKGHPAFDRVILEPPDVPTAKKLRAALGDKLKLHINPENDKTLPFDESLKSLLAFKPHSLSISYKKVNWEIMDAAHKAGVQVWVWTVNSEEIAEAAAWMGADAIKTDRPAWMLDLFKQSSAAGTAGARK